MANDITITLVYAGQLASEAEASQETVQTEAGTALGDVLQAAADRHGSKFQNLLFEEHGGLRRALIVSVDGTQVAEPATQQLQRSHEVFVMTPIAGG